LQSGAPFNITTGSDLYGTTLFNARPGFAADTTKQGLIATKYGLLDPNPPQDERLVPRNYGRGPAQFTVNIRIAKTIVLVSAVARVEALPLPRPRATPRPPLALACATSSASPPPLGAIT